MLIYLIKGFRLYLFAHIISRHRYKQIQLGIRGLIGLLCAMHLGYGTDDSSSPTVTATPTATTPAAQEVMAVPEVLSRGYTAEKIIFIGPVHFPCFGTSNRTCYQYKESPFMEWDVLYHDIVGFHPQANLSYELRIREVSRWDPHTQSSVIERHLINVIDENPVIMPASETSAPASSPSVTAQLHITEKTIDVGPSLVSCNHNASGQCYMYRPTPEEPWQMLPSGIEGFQHLSGYTYTLRIRDTQYPDTSSVMQLLEVLEHHPAPPSDQLSTTIASASTSSAEGKVSHEPHDTDSETDDNLPETDDNVSNPSTETSSSILATESSIDEESQLVFISTHNAPCSEESSDCYWYQEGPEGMLQIRFDTIHGLELQPDSYYELLVKANKDTHDFQLIDIINQEAVTP